jgi:5-methylcytosine-specific restriction protein A
MPWSELPRRERGYGPEWDRLRKRILERDQYLCQPCKRRGGYEPASEVDHIVSKAHWMKLYGTLDGVDAETNLQAISHRCHIAKTQAENGATPRPTIGVDGWPIDRKVGGRP